MKRSLTILLIIMIIFSSQSKAQTSNFGKLSGSIVDIETEEPLIGANIIVTGTTMGTMSNLQGQFTLSKIPVGKYRIKATIIGYKSQEQEIQILPGETARIKFALEETVLEMPALVVTAGKKAQSFQDVPNSVSLITVKEIERRNSLKIL